MIKENAALLERGRNVATLMMKHGHSISTIDYLCLSQQLCEDKGGPKQNRE
jgi:hypothetical protein